jgi:hypothetical protein
MRPDDVAEVGGLAAVGAGDGFDVGGPSPAGFEGAAPDRPTVEDDQLQLSLALEGADLLGCVQALPDQTCHDFLLG